MVTETSNCDHGNDTAVCEEPCACGCPCSDHFEGFYCENLACPCEAFEDD